MKKFRITAVTSNLSCGTCGLHILLYKSCVRGSSPYIWDLLGVLIGYSARVCPLDLALVCHSSIKKRKSSIIDFLSSTCHLGTSNHTIIVNEMNSFALPFQCRKTQQIAATSPTYSWHVSPWSHLPDSMLRLVWNPPWSGSPTHKNGWWP